MRTALALVLTALFVGLALLHVYWAAGGHVGHMAAVPEAGGRPLFRPSAFGTLMVAVALIMAALVISGVVGWLGSALPAIVFRRLTVALALVFLVRAIGDFRHVGFFRHASPSAFAYWDMRVYSPLCLFIAAAALVLAWSKR